MLHLGHRLARPPLNDFGVAALLVTFLCGLLALSLAPRRLPQARLTKRRRHLSGRGYRSDAATHRHHRLAT
jgi:hypothetical protein